MNTPHRLQALLIFFGSCCSLCYAQEAGDAWRVQRSLDPFYTQLAQDIHAGKPVVMATFCGQWDPRRAPEDDIHWGTKYGPWRMVDVAGKDTVIRNYFSHPEWERLALQTNDADPIRVAVYKQAITPNERWRALGVTEPFDLYHVLLLYKNKKTAALEATRALRQGKGRRIALAKGPALDLGQAQIVGYNGHNFYYDGPYDGLKKITGTPGSIKASVVIGCKSAAFFKEDLVDTNIHGLLYTTSFMAPEGYNLLALLDGIAEAESGDVLCKRCNAAYKHFQVLGGQKKPGPLFVNQAYRLFSD